MRQEDVKELLKRYSAGKATAEERALVEAWYEQFENYEQIISEAHLQSIEDEIFNRLPITEENKTRRLWPRLIVAASLIIGISTATYFVLRQEPNPQTALIKHDISPFSKVAILKTGHGKRILLDSTQQGSIARYANTHIQKTAGDQIAYSNNDKSDNKVIFDTLQVPAGSKPYHLKLADGSAIIVNVASTIRYPENFRKSDNEVELIDGEAYFAIIHNSESPLTIKAAGQMIEDVGTEFNVNIYSDEPDHRTTLIEGEIKVNHQDLSPGQQAIILNNTITIAKANIDQVTAWKNGYFRFNGEKIQAVMRELARWYNIEVKYEGKTADVGYFVKISRSKNISEVLKALERTNSVRFKIEGRRITVLSKK